MQRGEGEVKKDAANPLKIAWYALTTVASVASLSNMTEDLVEWKSVIGQLLQSYGELVYPVFRFLLGWLPIQFPEFVYDYLTVSILVTSALAKSYFGLNVVFDLDGGRIRTRLCQCAAVIFSLIVWPVIVGLLLLQLRQDDPGFRTMPLFVFRWLGAVMLGFIGLLLLNIVIGQWASAP